jgi:opacity protein-like surface antigen
VGCVVKKISVAVFSLFLGTSLANAADMPIVMPGPSIYGGTVGSPVALGGLQVGYNWQVPRTNLVFGVETDASAMTADGTATCLASSGLFISANCRVGFDASGSLTGRVGLATGPFGHTLFYAKGGVAWLHEQIGMTTAAFTPPLTSAFEDARWGWTAGVGVEKALTPAWSVRLEYDYANFGDVSVGTPQGLLQVIPPLNLYLLTPGTTSNVSQTLQTVKLGLNLKLGEDLHAQWQPAASDYRLRGTAGAAYIPDTEIEIGGRVWYSSGRFQKDLGGTTIPAQQDLLVSRLTYDTTSASGELFARVDTSSNLFLKGFIGGGSHLSGNMHDEDWAVFNASVPYSNTVSNPVTGDLGYATLDLGYALFHGPNAKVGGFIGYNYYKENKSAFGCVQIANTNSDCIPSIPNTTLGITENDRWDSLRLGVNSVVTLVDRLTLTADAAYLPFVSFRGTDNHVLRTDVADTVSPETGNGRGVQFEAILAYTFANSFSIGAGGRYWAMWTTDSYTNMFGTPCPCQTMPAKTERYGAFVQASYKLDGLK